MNAKDFIANRSLNIPKSAIHEMTRLSQQYKNVAFLSWAKPTTGTPSHINEAAIKAIQDGKTSGYSTTSGLIELRESIVEKLWRDNRIQASADEIIVSIGAVEALTASIMAVINPGDEVIIPTPAYSTHIRQVEMAGGVNKLVPCIENEQFRPDIDGIKAAITDKTKAIFFSSPNNPTGAVYSKEAIEAIAKMSIEHNLLVITDEAYEYFTFDGKSHISIASLEGMKERTISVFTFTKSYAMTGWRIGYLHAPKSIAEEITKMHIPMAICAPSVSQYAAIAALKGPQDCIQTFHSHYEAARNLMCERLDRLSHVFDYQKPEGAYLMFPKLIIPEGKDSFAFAKQMLDDIQVSATPGVAFRGESHLRLSFCVPEDMINTAFDRMEKYFK